MRFVYLTLSLVLSGCVGDGLEDLRDFVRTSDAGMRGKSFPSPEVKVYEGFVYDNQVSQLPDPFKPRKPKKGNQIELSVEKHEKQELENFPLESLKMIAFLEDKKNGPNAIIRAPDNRIFRVKIGNYVGMNNGKITAITSEKVVIKESVLDSEDASRERTNTLQLDDSGAPQ